MVLSSNILREDKVIYSLSIVGWTKGLRTLVSSSLLSRQSMERAAHEFCFSGSEQRAKMTLKILRCRARQYAAVRLDDAVFNACCDLMELLQSSPCALPSHQGVLADKDGTLSLSTAKTSWVRHSVARPML